MAPSSCGSGASSTTCADSGPFSSATWTAFTSDRHHAVLLVRALDVLVLGELERADHCRAGLARVDDVVDQGVPRRDVGIDRFANPFDHLGARRIRIVGRLDLLAE